VSGEGQWRSGTGSAPEGGGHGTGCPGQWAWPRVPEFREFTEDLDSAFRHGVGILGGPVWSQELDSVILQGSFPAYSTRL